MERPFTPGDIFGEQAFADVTIKYSGRQLRAHKIILSMRSKYFERAFPQDSGFKEAKEAVLQLHDDNPDALESMLRYIYTSDYPEVPSNEWEKHLGLAVTADKYGLDLLKELALEKLEKIKPFCKGNRTTPYYRIKPSFGPSVEFVVRIGNALLNESDRFQNIVNKHCKHDFKAFFQDRKFRKMLDRHTDVRDKLYVQHIRSVAGLPEFKTLIQSNDQLAAKYLQEVVQTYIGIDKEY